MQEAWFEVLLLRSNTVKEIQGGLSALVGALLGVFFSPDGHDMSLAGVSLQLADGETLHAFIDLGVVLADEAALRAIYACKGAAGLKPCVLCQNVFNVTTKRNVPANDPTGFAVDITCSDVNKLVKHTPETINAIARRLATARPLMNAASFGELQTRLGWNWGNGIISNQRWLDKAMPSKVCMFDWMHVWLVSGGVFNVHVGQLMKHTKAMGITYAKLDEYVKSFAWPVTLGSSAAKTCLEAKRARTHWAEEALKVTAGECLSLAPVLANFFTAVKEQSPNAALQRHAECFLLLCRVVELLQRTARVAVDPDVLEAAICAHMSAYKDLYGPDSMTPKFHSTMHFGDFLRRLGFLPNCFALERKHRTPKRHGNQIVNTSGAYEAGVLREVTSHHVHALCRPRQHFETAAGLIDPHPPSKRLAVELHATFNLPIDVSVATARIARINPWERVAVGDVVLAEHHGKTVCGKVVAHVSVETTGGVQTTTGLYRWEYISSGTRSLKYLKRSDTPLLLATDQLTCSVIWGGSGDVATIVRPHRVDLI